jgi:beta-lactamase class A
MITPVSTDATAAPNVQQYDYSYQTSFNDLRTFDRDDVKDAIKTFVLRHFVKKEVKENEQQQILTDVTLYDLDRDQKLYGHNEDTEHFAASINKLPVTLLLIEDAKAGKVTLDTTLTWAEGDKRAGNGTYDQPGAPTSATVRQVLFDMLNRSGNTAVRALVNGVLGGATAVNERLAAKPELTRTRLIPLDENRFYLGNTTSRESLWILREIMKEDASYATIVRNMLSSNIFVNDGFRSQLAGNDYVVLANKTGLLYDPDGNNVHDVGIIYNTKTGKKYGYSVLTTSPNDAVTPRADQSIKNMGKYVLRYAGDKPVEGTAEKPRILRAPAAAETKILY